MNHEYTLTEVQQNFVRSGREQLSKMRDDYLKMLGRAKEIEMQMDVLQQSTNQQIDLIVAGLPKAKTAYQMTTDGTKLIGELADAPPPAAPPQAPVNGVAGHGHEHV